MTWIQKFHTLSVILYKIFEIIVDLLYKSLISNSLCIIFFGLIYIVINLRKPINYNTNYKDKLTIIDSNLLFSLKNQFLYDVQVPYHVSLLDGFDLEGFIILSQQVAVVIILVFYKLKFVLELHKKYHIKWI